MWTYALCMQDISVLCIGILACRSGLDGQGSTKLLQSTSIEYEANVENSQSMITHPARKSLLPYLWSVQKPHEILLIWY